MAVSQTNHLEPRTKKYILLLWTSVKPTLCLEFYIDTLRVCYADAVQLGADFDPESTFNGFYLVNDSSVYVCSAPLL